MNTCVKFLFNFSYSSVSQLREWCHPKWHLATSIYLSQITDHRHAIGLSPRDFKSHRVDNWDESSHTCFLLSLASQTPQGLLFNVLPSWQCSHGPHGSHGSQGPPQWSQEPWTEIVCQNKSFVSLSCFHWIVCDNDKNQNKTNEHNCEWNTLLSRDSEISY